MIKQNTCRIGLIPLSLNFKYLPLNSEIVNSFIYLQIQVINPLTVIIFLLNASFITLKHKNMRPLKLCCNKKLFPEMQKEIELEFAICMKKL